MAKPEEMKLKNIENEEVDYAAMRPLLLPSGNFNWTPGVTLAELEKEAILKAMVFFGGNKTKAAHALGISARTVDNKLKEYVSEAHRRIDAEAAQRRKQAEINERLRGTQITERYGLGSNSQLYGFPRASEGNATHEPSGNESAAGDASKPAAQVSAEQTMPVPKREEVQEVSLGSSRSVRNR